MADAPDTTETKRDYRSTVFLPKTDFPMKAGLPQKEPVIAARWKAEDLYGQVRKARAGREKFIFHDGPPYANGDIHIGPRAQQDAEGHGRPHPDPAGQGRALRARLGLPRPADRMEDRGAVPQEEAQQGRGPAEGVPRRVPRLCAALGERAARAVPAARHHRRLGQSVSDDGFPGGGDDRLRIVQVRRERPALSRRQAGDVVAGREDRAGRGRDRI